MFFSPQEFDCGPRLKITVSNFKDIVSEFYGCSYYINFIIFMFILEESFWQSLLCQNSDAQNL